VLFLQGVDAAEADEYSAVVQQAVLGLHADIRKGLTTIEEHFNPQSTTAPRAEEPKRCPWCKHPFVWHDGEVVRAIELQVSQT